MMLTVEYYFTHPQDKLGMYASDPEDNSHEHSHEFAELVIVEEGHGLHVINGRPLYIQQGDVFYVQPGDVHYYDELGTLKLIKEGANKRGNSSRLTQSFHFFMFEPIFSPVNALNQPI